MRRSELYYDACCWQISLCFKKKQQKTNNGFAFRPHPSFNHTQDGQDRPVFEHLHGAGADEEDGLQSVALSQEVLPRSAEGRLDVERQRAQAAAAGGGEQRQLQDLLVKVHGDVGPQLVREVLQQLANVTG